MKVYIVRDNEAGNPIDWFTDAKEARHAVKVYEKDDKKEGTYTEDFYEIYEKEAEVKDLRRLMGATQDAFCRDYEIPRRTLEDWETGKRTPPAYVVALLERAVMQDLKAGR